MKIYFNSLLITLLLATATVKAQDVQLGLSLETNTVKVDNKSANNKDAYPITAIHLGLAVFPTNDFAVDVRFGVEADVDFFKGTELALEPL